MPSSEVTLALYVPLIAKDDKISDLTAFLGAGYDLVQEEPETIQWYGIRYDDHSPPTFAILDTFRGESGRKAHLTGKVAEALGAHAPTLLAEGPTSTSPLRPSKSFLAGALPLFEAETETLNAYILQFPGTDRFAIVDFFENDAGRNAHLGWRDREAAVRECRCVVGGPPRCVKFTVIAASVNV
ncbi:hypothetical protein B0H16DRAFT_1580831 [Mycena metata]|uniref:ABM domain-containing protein n=1 Tax=Mycena metata TaxID=1033252 RepID=A0AAD7MU42_9AGAR|nr:hypothetical protein B0H16DRAFT_1580831 [Mycena metata]